jgi:hypothetical protein
VKKIINAPRWLEWIFRILFFALSLSVLYWATWSDAAKQYDLRKSILDKTDEYILLSQEWQNLFRACEKQLVRNDLFLKKHKSEIEAVYIISLGFGQGQEAEESLNAVKEDISLNETEYRAFVNCKLSIKTTYYWLVRCRVEKWREEEVYPGLERDLKRDLREIEESMLELTAILERSQKRFKKFRKKYQPLVFQFPTSKK